MLSQENFNMVVAKNLASYRKLNGFTQLDLAEKLNYSDKAISKWERGECLPDVYTLNLIADLYEISVNDLLSSKPKLKTPSKKTGKFFVPLLSITAVWLVAILSFFFLEIFLPNGKSNYLAFIVAIPVCFIILTIFTCIYHNFVGEFISISALVWTIILTLDISFTSIYSGISFLYVVGIPLQVAIILWFAFKWFIKRRKNKP